MKRDEILRMKAGNKLDMLVELYVFQWPNGYDDARDVPKYSTEMGAAWLVMEKLTAEGACPALFNDDYGKWGLSFSGSQSLTQVDRDFVSTFWLDRKLFRKSAPLAICLSALLATSVDE